MPTRGAIASNKICTYKILFPGFVCECLFVPLVRLRCLDIVFSLIPGIGIWQDQKIISIQPGRAGLGAGQGGGGIGAGQDGGRLGGRAGQGRMGGRAGQNGGRAGWGANFDKH